MSLEKNKTEKRMVFREGKFQFLIEWLVLSEWPILISVGKAFQAKNTWSIKVLRQECVCFVQEAEWMEWNKRAGV